jgi:hypothetical protein
VRIGEVVIRPIEQRVCATWFQQTYSRRSSAPNNRRTSKDSVRRKAYARR